LTKRSLTSYQCKLGLRLSCRLLSRYYLRSSIDEGSLGAGMKNYLVGGAKPCGMSNRATAVKIGSLDESDFSKLVNWRVYVGCEFGNVFVMVNGVATWYRIPTFQDGMKSF
jgi:hypothetical protein